MMKTIVHFMAECLVCQKSKEDTPAGLIQPLPIPNRVWEDVSMDFITGLSRSQSWDVILVVVNRLLKAAHLSASPPLYRPCGGLVFCTVGSLSSWDSSIYCLRPGSRFSQRFLGRVV